LTRLTLREIGAAFELSLSTEIFSTMLILIGSAGAVLALLELGRSFSMMTEAHRLVPSGPYRFVR
jgi:protein-S-isoprenylcysteine O-methyltransferase Ste14